MLKAIPRKPKFDPGANFIIVRAMRHGGQVHGPGQPFDKSTVGERRLRQLYEANYLKQIPVERIPLKKTERIRLKKKAA